MFLGHYAVALGAKKVVPTISLGTLLLSAQFADLLWPIFLLMGLEHVRIAPGTTVVSPFDFYDYPVTHSLVGALGWSLLFGLIYFIARRYPKGAWILAAGVFSHWVLDMIGHRPDLPLVPGGTIRVGFGLWNSLPGTLVVELGLFLVGITLYVRTTRPLDRTGAVCLVALRGGAPDHLHGKRVRPDAIERPGRGDRRRGTVGLCPVGVLGRPAPRGDHRARPAAGLIA